MADALGPNISNGSVAAEESSSPMRAAPDVIRSMLPARGWKGVNLTIDEIGDGRQVVYLHGLVGNNTHWFPIVRELAHKSRSTMIGIPLLALDGQYCSVAAISDQVARTLEDLFDQPVVVVGSSFGGHVAAWLASERPELLNGLVLTGSSGLFEVTVEEELERGLMKKVQHRPSHDWLNRKIEELFFDKSRMPQGVVDMAYDELSQRQAARAMVRLSKSTRRDHVSSRLPRITAPTLVLWGSEDVVTPPRVAEEFDCLIRDSRLRWIEDCGHAPMIECPTQFTHAVSEFLDELETGSNAVGPRQEVA